jgi:hypothetical protein
VRTFQQRRKSYRVARKKWKSVLLHVARAALTFYNRIAVHAAYNLGWEALVLCKCSGVFFTPAATGGPCELNSFGSCYGLCSLQSRLGGAHAARAHGTARETAAAQVAGMCVDDGVQRMRKGRTTGHCG